MLLEKTRSIGAAATERSPQVQEEIGLLEKNLNELECELSRLENRVEPVLKPTNTIESDEKAPESVLVPLADKIRQSRRFLGALAERLSVLVDRIDL